MLQHLGLAHACCAWVLFSAGHPWVELCMFDFMDHGKSVKGVLPSKK